MFRSSPGVNKAIPQEYRQIAEALFPMEGLTQPRVETAVAFAETLGIGADYRHLLGNADTLSYEMDIHKFLGHFQNNLDLLIQKTWVNNKLDEDRKERLRQRVPGFITGIEGGDYQKAIVDFGAILEELAYLFFGPQSQQEDFTEYTFRIDTQVGLFWWYGGQLGHLHPVNSGAVDTASLRAILLIGICYLTNF
ncbi:MAG: hypothetical protein LBT13_11270 [Treponema sp.]|jgi:hypothetical protein|nr:hypothetical protein [Treponema sp.]